MPCPSRDPVRIVDRRITRSQGRRTEESPVGGPAPWLRCTARRRGTLLITRRSISRQTTVSSEVLRGRRCNAAPDSGDRRAWEGGSSVRRPAGLSSWTAAHPLRGSSSPQVIGRSALVTESESVPCITAHDRPSRRLQCFLCTSGWSFTLCRAQARADSRRLTQTCAQARTGSRRLAQARAQAQTQGQGRCPWALVMCQSKVKKPIGRWSVGLIDDR